MGCINCMQGCLCSGVRRIVGEAKHAAQRPHQGDNNHPFNDRLVLISPTSVFARLSVVALTFGHISQCSQFSVTAPDLVNKPTLYIQYQHGILVGDMKHQAGKLGLRQLET